MKMYIFIITVIARRHIRCKYLKVLRDTYICFMIGAGNGVAFLRSDDGRIKSRKIMSRLGTRGERRHGICRSTFYWCRQQRSRPDRCTCLLSTCIDIMLHDRKIQTKN